MYLLHPLHKHSQPIQVDVSVNRGWCKCICCIPCTSTASLFRWTCLSTEGGASAFVASLAQAQPAYSGGRVCRQRVVSVHLLHPLYMHSQPVQVDVSAD